MLLLWCTLTCAVMANAVLGIWVTGVEGMPRTLCLLFLIPALAGIMFGAQPSGSSVKGVVAATIVILGGFKVVFAIAASALAQKALITQRDDYNGETALLFAFLAILGVLSGLSDVTIGCVGWRTFQRHRRHTMLAAVEF